MFLPCVRAVCVCGRENEAGSSGCNDCSGRLLFYFFSLPSKMDDMADAIATALKF